MGNSGISQRKGGTDTLVQQISGKDKANVGFPDPRFVHQLFQHQLLHMFFRLFPGLLAKIGVPTFDVKGMI